MLPRNVCSLALVGLLLVPDGATALGWRTRYCPPPGEPVYASPPQVILLPLCLPYMPILPPCEPDYWPVLPPPRVQQLAPPEKPAEKPAEKPVEKPVKPATGDIPLATPTPAPLAIEPPVIKPDPAPAKRIEENPASKIPPTPNLPITPPAPPTTKLEPLKLPDPTLPKSPPVEPLNLPVSPKTPGLVVPKIPAPSESKFRPDAKAAFEVLAVDGTGPTRKDGKWEVGFYNYTGKPLELTVGGKTVPLASQSFVTAVVETKFTWKVTGLAEETTTVPAASGGVEVVLK